MKKIVIFFLILCISGIFLGLWMNSGYASEKNISISHISTANNQPQRILSGNQISVFSTTFNNLTFNLPIPNSPKTVRIYKGYFKVGDLVENITGSIKEIKNPISKDQAPDFAAKILKRQYGGLPPDAELQYSYISYGEILNRTTGEVEEKKPEETFVSWHRTVDGMRVEGGSDIIQVELGEEGNVIRVYKSWRTLEPVKNVSIISANDAIEKLGDGDVLNPGSGIQQDVEIYDIHLSYYVKGIDDPEVTLEPIWVFYGNASGTYLPFFIYARQFANFTATPVSGKTPLTVRFNDTSDASPTVWYWNFGDGTNSTEQNPVHTYTNGGRYNVSLRAWNDLGSDTAERTGYIIARSPAVPVAGFTASPTTGPAPLRVQFNDTSKNIPTGWFWEFGDGSNATAQNPAHTYLRPGNYTVSLNVTNSDGADSITKNEFIRVTDLPQTTITTLPTTTVTVTTTATGTTTTLTTVTTRPTTVQPTVTGTTEAPLSPAGALAGIVMAGLGFSLLRRRQV